MMIVDTLTSIELALRETPDQRFVCIEEILERSPASTKNAKNPLTAPVTIHPNKDFPDIRTPWHTHVIPDGLFGIEYLIEGKKRYRFWALECERTSPIRRSHSRASSLTRKHAAYQALIHSGGYKAHWNIPNLKLLVMTENDTNLMTTGSILKALECPKQ
jgi:hypothetical protein